MRRIARHVKQRRREAHVGISPRGEQASVQQSECHFADLPRGYFRPPGFPGSRMCNERQKAPRFKQSVSRRGLVMAKAWMKTLERWN
ncbi:protein of unknown function [Methylocaldum szegediense]|uniref:Uncharacterized protein n=1 Tax=Methylocaldum szegediense TaxID=73780 RepID=A0ABN8X8F7_9GAMM|nr:protein of unknown function [Methylocaldum szegediense]